jgi:antitoxin MazE
MYKRNIMKVSVIPIGNSKGIRLPKTVLEKYHITESVELTLEKNQITLKPNYSPRQGWEKAFKEMHEHQADKLIIDDVFIDENFEEWN